VNDIKNEREGRIKKIAEECREKKSCLVLVDIQEDFLSPHGISCRLRSREKLVNSVKRLLCEKKCPFSCVVAARFINKPDSPFMKCKKYEYMTNDSKGKELDSYVSSVSERVFDRCGYSIFTDEFKRYIRENGIEEIYLAGADTDGAVLKSALDAFELGFDVKVIMDCCASRGDLINHMMGISVMERTLGYSSLIDLDYFADKCKPYDADNLDALINEYMSLRDECNSLLNKHKSLSMSDIFKKCKKTDSGKNNSNNAKDIDEEDDEGEDDDVVEKNIVDGFVNALRHTAAYGSSVNGVRGSCKNNVDKDVYDGRIDRF
jgi:nicotinamidase-related amidase